MEETVRKLLELLLGAVPTFLIVLALYVFLRVVFFGPLEKVLEERHAATEGMRQAAAQSMATAEAKTGEHAAALEQARIKIYSAQERERQQALEERAGLLARARAQAGERIRAARQEIQAAIDAGRERLRSESRSLADSIARVILK